MIKRVLALVIVCVVLLGAASCVSSGRSESDMPDDFSFSIIWGCYGDCSYDSESGKLVKSYASGNGGLEGDDYTAFVKLSEEDLRTAYRLLFCDIDITEYPDSYDPFNPPGETALVSMPHERLSITVRANGETKTVTCEQLSFGNIDDCYSAEARDFYTSKVKLVGLIKSLPEWKELPEPTANFD